MTSRQRLPQLALLVLLLLLPGLPALAQPAPDQPAGDAAATTSEPAAIATDAAVAPAPVTAEPAAPFDAEAATRAYLARQTPEQKERSDAYFEGGYWLQLWGFLYGIGIAWLLLGTRLSAKIRDFAARITRRKFLQSALYGAVYVVLTTVLGFPLTVYQGYFREHQYGMATQTFGPWLGDQATGLGVGVVLMGLLLGVLYAVFRKAPRTWWLWGSVVGVAFITFVILISPVYIDPLFNKYTLLEDPKVLDPILSLARANGIHTDKVYEFDASRQTTRVSANVSGFLGTMRVRLNDNLLKRCSLPEIKAVMGHEMGHYVLNHVYSSIVFLGLLLVGGFAFIRSAYDRVLARWGGRWGVRGISDPAGFPLLVALFSLYFFVLTPVFNNYIRSNEAEADIFGLNASAEPDGFAEVALKLGEYRKLDPGPLEEWFFYDHPSGRNRIAMAMRWKAEHLDGHR